MRASTVIAGLGALALFVVFLGTKKEPRQLTRPMSRAIGTHMLHTTGYSTVPHSQKCQKRNLPPCRLLTVNTASRPKLVHNFPRILLTLLI